MNETRLDRTAARKLAAARAHDAEFLSSVATVLAGLERLRPHLEGEEAGAFSMAYQGLTNLRAIRACEPVLATRIASLVSLPGKAS